MCRNAIRWLPFFLFLVLCAPLAAGETNTADRGWCVIEAPQHVAAGQKFTVKITVKEVPEGTKLGGDFHYIKEDDSYGGYAAWGGALRGVKAGETLTINYTMPAMKDGMKGVNIMYFLSPKGWEEKVKDASAPAILFNAAAAANQAKAEAAPAAGETLTADRGWCVIESPKQVGASQKFSVKITVKEVPAGTKLGGDLHYMKEDGSYGGYAAWGGNTRNVKAGDVLTLNYTMPALKDGIKGVNIMFFLSPKGWEQKVKDAATQPIVFDAAYVDPKGRPETATLKKSWIKTGKPVKTSAPETPWTEGDEISVPIEYYVDKTDDWGGTGINVWVVGPWIDNPDGKYSTKRTHVNYNGLGGNIKCEIGKVVKTEFKMILPKPFTAAAPDKGKFGDGGIFIFTFKGFDGKLWPWQHRVGFGAFARKDAFFELDAPTPGNLFTYAQPVKMQMTLGSKAVNGGAKKAQYRVTDVAGKEVAAGVVDFTAGAKGQVVDIPLTLKERGTFLLNVKVEGWEEREITFARIPDLEKIIGKNPTPFGGQKFAGNTEATKVARMMGMSTCRIWTNWKTLEPAPEQWDESAFAELEKTIDELNAHYIRPWILFDAPPPWAIKNPAKHATNFVPFPFDDAEVERIVTKLATRFKDKIIGFEWQNEIVPGDVTPNPVEDYLRLCKVATAAAKKVNPKFTIQSAGGLWPRSYLKSLLAGGLNNDIDILSVHYSSGSNVLQAQGDLTAVAAKNVLVWDNETARGYSTWKMPLSVAMQYKGQSNYFMERFPGELLAGCQQIVVFGGEPDAAGNWSHFWGDMSPRPAAATLAVLTSKLSLAKPLGEFSLGKGAACKLFANGKKAVLVVSTSEKGGESVSLPSGTPPMIATDQQGNERALTTANGITSLALTAEPYFAEGGDLEIIEAQLVAQIAGAGIGIPQLSFVKGAEANIPLKLHNYYQTPLTCTLGLRAEGAPGTAEKVVVKLKPGETAPAVLKFTAANSGAFASAVEVTFDNPKLPKVTKNVHMNIINPDSIGNLLLNPGFEEGQGEKAADWGGCGGDNGKRVAYSKDDEPGHGQYVYSFTNTAGKYRSIWQTRKDVVPGEYVYSMWIKADNLQTGSNASTPGPNGKSINHSWMQVFNAPAQQKYWDVFTAKLKVDTNGNFSVSPVANGKGVSWIDNLSLTLYEGTEYNAVAPKAKGAIKIDGNLADFNRAYPIPLLGKSQLRTNDKNYKWTPQNLSGAAWFNWDATNLYVGVEVIDEKHVAAQQNEKANQDDSVEIAIHPLNRLAGEDSKAFVYYLSAANPGGGSGKHTIFRPADRSGGLKSGSLAKDSSVYDIVVKREGSKTIYEVAIPFSELGGIINSFGTKFGLSIVLNDNDGAGRAACMVWGEGLRPSWSPSSLGMMVLTEK